MKLFGKRKNTNTLNPLWKFSQKGNLWRFFFAGKNMIVGETRDNEAKVVYFFSLDVSKGKTFLKNHRLKNEDYWISIEGLNKKICFLHRFEKPDLPQHKSIIALDIFSGKKLWENNEYLYFFNTDQSLYAYKEKFESKEIVELNVNNGMVLNTFDENEHDEIYKIRNDSYSEQSSEKYNYPIPFSKEETPEDIPKIFKKEITLANSEGKIEYIIKDDYLMFNYYEKISLPNGVSKKTYKNKFCIYNIFNGEKLYKDIMNRTSSYNVPDNFFVKDDNLYYLREKKELIAINLKQK